MTEKTSRYDNLETEIVDNYLIIRCHLDENQVDVQPSASGKTLVIATSGGAIRIGENLRLNLTLYRKP